MSNASGAAAQRPAQLPQTDARKIGFRLGLGIVFMPYIFSWLTLRKGHTRTQRIASFGWMGLVLIAAAAAPATDKNAGLAASAATGSLQQRVADQPRPQSADHAAVQDCAARGMRSVQKVDTGSGAMTVTCEPSASAATAAPASAAPVPKLSKKEAQAMLTELRNLERAGREMDALREAANLPDGPLKLDKLRRCGERMRELQPKARELRQRATGLPDSVIDLGIAATHLELCVSCSTRLALENCDGARDALRTGSTALARAKW
jgi:hypothetical protein